MPSRMRSGSSPAWPSCDQADGAHDLARRAEAALEAVMGDEGGLHGMQRVAVRQALDRQDVRAVAADRESEAGIDPPPVDEDRAGAALAAVAALLGPGQLEALAQQVEQRDARVVQHDFRVTPLTVREIGKLMRCSSDELEIRDVRSMRLASCS